MISDNGKAFEAKAKVIKSVTSIPEEEGYYVGLGSEWTFNVPMAQGWGGMFESVL